MNDLKMKYKSTCAIIPQATKRDRVYDKSANTTPKPRQGGGFNSQRANVLKGSRLFSGEYLYLCK